MHPWPNIRKQRAARPPSNGGPEWFGRRGSSCRSRRRRGSQDAIGSSDGYGGGRGKVPARFLSNGFPAALGSFPGWLIVGTARSAATGGCTAAGFPFVSSQLSGYVKWKSHLLCARPAPREERVQVSAPLGPGRARGAAGQRLGSTGSVPPARSCKGCRLREGRGAGGPFRVGPSL